MPTPPEVKLQGAALTTVAGVPPYIVMCTAAEIAAGTCNPPGLVVGCILLVAAGVTYWYCSGDRAQPRPTQSRDQCDAIASRERLAAYQDWVRNLNACVYAGGGDEGQIAACQRSATIIYNERLKVIEAKKLSCKLLSMQRPMF